MNYKKIRPRRRKFKNNKVLYLFLLFLLIGVGYAALTTNLSITGTTNVATNSWNIHFDNLQIKSSSVEGNPDASIAGNSLSISYGASLAQPGDYYEFAVDVVNEGTLPCKISLVNLTGNSTNYLSTSYSYVGGHEVKVGDILDIGESKKIVISTWIPSDIDTSLLPTEDTPITLTLNLQYVQSEIDGVYSNPCTYEGILYQGAEYVNGQYTYRYMQESTGSGWQNISYDGWGVTLTDKNSTVPVTTNLCTAINNKPIVSMAYMFYNSKTTYIDVSSFNTSHVYNMFDMFYRAENIETLDLSNFDTSNVTDMSYMFGYCNNIVTLNLSNFDFRRLNKTYLIPGLLNGGITNLKNIVLSGSKYSGTMEGAFSGLSNVLDITLDYVDTSNVYVMSSLFSGDSSITNLDLSSFDITKVTNMDNMLKNMSSLEDLNMDNWDFSNYNRNNGYIFYYMNDRMDNPSIRKVSLKNAVFPVDCSNFFDALTNLQHLNLKNVDTSNSVIMKYMFYNSPELLELDVSSFDTSNVTDMRYMFRYIPKVKELDLSNFDTTKVTTSNFWGMFDGLRNLDRLDMSGLDFSMFDGANTSIGIDNITTKELVTPKNVNMGTSTIGLVNTMYAQGDSVGINRIDVNTLPNTVYKDHIWN